MKTKRNITKQDLERLIRHWLEMQGESRDYQIGYLKAMETAGWLAPGKPEWIRQAAHLHIESRIKSITRHSNEHM